MSDWEFYVVLAERYGWRPDQVDEMDPDFIDNVAARLRAEALHDENDRRRKAAHAQAYGDRA